MGEDGETRTDGPQEGVLAPLTEIERLRLLDPLESARAALRASNVERDPDCGWPNCGCPWYGPCGS